MKAIQLGGKQVFVSQSRKPLADCHGFFEVDKQGRRRIVLAGGLSDRERLDTFLHESLHALFYFLDESVVNAAATELTEALEVLEFV